MLTLTAVRQAQNTQIEAQRKGRGFEKKVSCVGTRSKAERSHKTRRPCLAQVRSTGDSGGTNFAIIMFSSVCDKVMPHRGRLIIEKAVIVKRLLRSHLKMEMPVQSDRRLLWSLCYDKQRCSSIKRGLLRSCVRLKCFSVGHYTARIAVSKTQFICRRHDSGVNQLCILSWQGLQTETSHSIGSLPIFHFAYLL